MECCAVIVITWCLLTESSHLLQEESVSGDSTAKWHFMNKWSHVYWFIFFITWQICEQFIGETLAVETASEAMQVNINAWNLYTVAQSVTRNCKLLVIFGNLNTLIYYFDLILFVICVHLKYSIWYGLTYTCTVEEIHMDTLWVLQWAN